MALANAAYHNAVLGQVDPCAELGPDMSTLAEHQQVGGPEAMPAQDDESSVIQININNVVSSFSTRCHLNLRTIAMNGMNVVMRKESGMVSKKIRKPYTTASIWSSGKITVTGATSEEEARIASRKIARSLQKLGFRCKFANFRVVNVLGTCSLPFGIKIQSFSKQYPREASYEPELHPGVTYKIKDPKATLKIFSTGSITVTAPRVSNVEQAIQHIYPLVYDYQMEKASVKAEDRYREEIFLTNPQAVKKATSRETHSEVYHRPHSEPTEAPTAKFQGKRRYQPLANYKSLKRPKEDWSGSSDDDFDSDDSQD